MTEFSIVARHDCTLTSAEDEALRELFKLCFKRELAYLDHQRFFRELPQHRWMIFDETGENIIAHIAVYDKVLGTDDGLLPVAGVAEVCTHPDYRGQGRVRAILAEVHNWAKQQGFAWMMLFGSHAIYGGSGYERAHNPIRALDYKSGEWKTETLKYALICPLGNAKWPDGTLDLRGPHF